MGDDDTCVEAGGEAALPKQRSSSRSRAIPISGYRVIVR